MDQPSAKQLIIITLVIFAALALTLSLILRNSFDFRGLSLDEMPGWRLAYDRETGTALPNDPDLILPRPVELARTPTAARFDMPMGSEHAALRDFGDTVYSIGSGRVIYSGDTGSDRGKVIIVSHRLADGSLKQSFYSHCDHSDVAVGFNVVRGELIGTVGKGGGADPAHLSFEVRDSVCPNPSRDYYQRRDPTGVVNELRNAATDLLNPAPQIPVPENEIHP